MESKRGQLTIFVVVALLVATAVLVFFLWSNPSLGFQSSAALGFDGCVSNVITGAATSLVSTAGIPESAFTYSYNGQEIPYICYSNNFYETCTVQQPLIKQTFERALQERTRQDVEDCYASSVEDLKSQGYEVTAGEISYETLLEPGVIMIPVEAPTTVGSRSFTKVTVEVNSPVYEMVMIATSVLQQETRFGDANIDALNFNFPDYTVLKFKRGDGTTIYTIRSKLFGDEMQFASRSLAWPAGFG